MSRISSISDCGNRVRSSYPSFRTMLNQGQNLEVEVSGGPGSCRKSG